MPMAPELNAKKGYKLVGPARSPSNTLPSSRHSSHMTHFQTLLALFAVLAVVSSAPIHPEGDLSAIPGVIIVLVILLTSGQLTPCHD
jgi:hypothetical protein